MSGSEGSSGNPSTSRGYLVPSLLVAGMATLIGVSVFEGSRGSAQAAIAPAQYTSSTPSNAFADPFVIAGLALGILVIVFAILLFVRIRRGGGPLEGAKEPEEGSEPATEAEAHEEAGDTPETSATTEEPESSETS